MKFSSSEIIAWLIFFILNICIYVDSDFIFIFDIIYKGNKKYVSSYILRFAYYFDPVQILPKQLQSFKTMLYIQWCCHLGTALINNSEHMRTGFAATSHK